MNAGENYLVVGLGNPLRQDDGVGLQVLEALGRLSLPPGVVPVEGGQAGLGLLDLLDGAPGAVIVDCAEMGLPPGTVRTFQSDQPMGPDLVGAVHSMRTHTALEVGRAIGRLPPLRIVGVQPRNLSWGVGLSPEAAAAVPRAARAALLAVDDLQSEGGKQVADGKIFIVDDDPDMVDALRLPLEARGYTVAHAGTGREALERMADVAPDLVILDVMMETDTAGFQTAYQLRNAQPGSTYRPFSRVPILMLTAIGPQKSMAFSPDTDGDFLPVDAYIEKPVRPETLLQKVAELLCARERP